MAIFVYFCNVFESVISLHTFLETERIQGCVLRLVLHIVGDSRPGRLQKEHGIF